MPTQLADNEFFLRCACYSSGHSAMLIHEPNEQRGNNLKGEDDDWYLSVQLDNSFDFWKRLRLGIRYICGFYIPYGNYAEIVLRTQDIADLEDFIARRRNPDGL